MMNHKPITLAAYTVTAYDLREPRPRRPLSFLLVVDAADLTAAHSLNVILTDHIRRQYEARGYLVESVKVAGSRRTVDLDLAALWESAAPAEVDV